MNRDFYIYILFRETGTPFYVGKGRGNRWLHHERDTGKNDTHKDRIIRKILLTRNDVPKIKIVEGLTNIEAKRLEILFIASIGRYPQGPLVNHTRGGDGCVDPSNDVRLRMSSSHTGVRLSDETRAKMSAVSKGKPKSREHVANAAAAGRGLKRSEETCRRIGLAHINPSDATRKKMRESHLGHTQSLETREKIGRAFRGKKLSSEHVEKLRQSALMKSPEVNQKIAHRMREVWAQRKAAEVS